MALWVPDQAWLALPAPVLRRRLLIGLIQACTPDLDGVWSWSAGADDASTRAGRATTGDAAMRSPQCRCSINRQHDRGLAHQPADSYRRHDLVSIRESQRPPAFLWRRKTGCLP
jgi:hypothetical protein